MLSIIIIILLAFPFLIQIIKVYKFRNNVLTLCYYYDLNHLDEVDVEANYLAISWFFKSGPTFNQMLFSFEPLELESFYPKHKIDKILEK